MLEPDALKGACPVPRRPRAQQCVRGYPTGRALSPTPPRLLPSSVDSAVFTGKPRPRAGSVVHDAADFRVLGAERRAGFRHPGIEPELRRLELVHYRAGLLVDRGRAATGAPQPAAHRGRRTAQPRGDHAMPLADGGVQQRSDDHLGPVAPTRHRRRRKQHVRLRARMADRPPGPQRATVSLTGRGLEDVGVLLVEAGCAGD